MESKCFICGIRTRWNLLWITEVEWKALEPLGGQVKFGKRDRLKS